MPGIPKSELFIAFNIVCFYKKFDSLASIHFLEAGLVYKEGVVVIGGTTLVFIFRIASDELSSRSLNILHSTK